MPTQFYIVERELLKLSFVLFILTLATIHCNAQDVRLRALIVDGQNNHKVWPKSTIMMRQYLEETGLFEVDVARTRYLMNSVMEARYLPLANAGKGVETNPAKTDPDFKPNFSKYDVVISNFGYRAAPWPEETQEAFECYIRNGGGFVSVHAADNCFPKWKAYNQIIGLGGWGGRTEADGPYVYVNELGKVVRDNSPGITGKHGKKEAFLITLREVSHPICSGLPKMWMHAYDECYAYLRGPAEDLSILATAVSSLSLRSEPMLMTIGYYEGRVFHTTLGHDTKAFECVGFITTFQRGVEWAASGMVSQGSVPDDFPTANAVSLRRFEMRK